MKLFVLFSFLGLIAAVSAISISTRDPVSPTFDIRTRETRKAGYIGENSLAPGKDYLQERNLGSKVDYFDARDVDFNSISEREYYELSEREYYELEERNPALAVRVAVQVIKLIVKAIKAAIEKDKKMRGEWTMHMVQSLRAKYPHHNFVVCHTKHTTQFVGAQGKDWGHSHHELKVSFRKTIGFEIYWFNEGTFVRKGDGGYLNWAYGGNIKHKSGNGKTVQFGKP